MTAMDSKKSQVSKKKGKHWVYFAKHGKKSTSIQDPAASTKPSGTDGNALPHKPGNHFIKAHMKKQKRKRKVPKLLEKMISKDKDKQTGSDIEGSSASAITSEITVKASMKKIDDSANQDKIDKNNNLKAKQQKKKRKRKLKILKRKEKEKRIKESVTSESQVHVTLVTTGPTKKSKRTSGQANSNKTISATTDKELDRETSKDEENRLASAMKQESDKKRMSKKRKRKDELDAKRKKKKKKPEIGDSGMSSCTDEIPHLPEEPQDVASNWKALESKLKASAPKKPKLKARNRNASDKAVNKKSEIWFDDVDPALLEAEKEGSSEHNVDDSTQAPAGNKKITKCIALDCEMVGVGHEGKESILARVSMVNEYGQCIYDKFVKPREKVTDFRTEFSGVRPKDLFKGNAEEFLTVQKEVADIMKDRILVGHALKNDMKVLYLGHPRRLIRDTATYPHFRELMKTKRPALKKLAKTVLGVTVQEGEHNSVEDAQTAMRLYTLHRTAWEKSLKHRGKIIKK